MSKEPSKEKEKPVRSNNDQLVEKLLFQQVKKPKYTTHTKIVNVFENRYRINVYVQLEENGFTKQKIGASYFARLDGETLNIVMGL